MHDASKPIASKLNDLCDLSASARLCCGDANSFAELTARYQTLQQHNRWLSELGDTTARMLQQESVDTLLQHIAEELVNVSCANGAYMHMVHETGDYLDILAAFGPLSDYLLGGKRYKGHGLSARVWESGIIQFVPDYNNHPDCVLELDTQIQAVLLPLSFAGEVLGVVFVTAEIDAPLDDDLDLLKQVAVIASLLIHHARQREAVSRELFRTQTLSLISATIHQHQHWDDLAYHVCPKLFDVLDLSRLSLSKTASSLSQLEAYASWCRIEGSIELCETVNSTLLNETISAWCFRNKKTAQINRAIKDARESAATHNFRKERDIGSTLSVPIIAGDTVWGVMTVCRKLDKRDFDQNDVNTLHTVIGQMSTALQRQNLLLEVQHQALHDSLTDLPNRRRFEEFLEEILRDESKAEIKKAVLFFDLDGFKNVNDSHGHAAGDAVLRQVAKRLSERAKPDVMLARLGGDEFSVVLPQLHQLDDAVQCAARFAESFTESFNVGQQEFNLGVSVGISFYPRDGVDKDDLIRHADMAMYQAKRKGRNRIVSFDHNLAKSSREEQNREIDLRKAISEQEFDLWYQPQVSLQTGLVCGVEALIRWQHPTKGILPPMKFIPLAEELGLISLVGTWVLERGCQQMVDWQHEDPVPWHMGINVSAPQVMKKEFAASVLKILEVYGIDPEKLQLEVTESMLLSDIDSVVGNFQLLRAHGVNIALDDFGTGYSSFKYLQELPVDILKIDRGFICELEEVGAMESFASTIVLLANRFGLTTVAEGVETREQLESVKQLNCDLVQGFYFSKPVTAVDLPQVITNINQAQYLKQNAA
jgi:diguanylate cyclase (GGDEF)-like protein